jgi:streptogramin lyase
MAAGAGAMWIANISLKEVERIDASSNKIAARIKVNGVPCSGAAFGFSSVWIPLCGNDKGTSLVRIDAAKNRVVATLPIAPANSEGGITASPDSLWMATGDTTLSRIDPSSGKVRQRVVVPPGSQNPVYSDGLVWITSKASNTVTAVDAKSGNVAGRVVVPGGPHFVGAGGGAVWTIGQNDGVVTRIDPRTKRVVARIDANIAGFGGDVTYGAGYVWTTLVSIPLTKIDAATNRVVAQYYGAGGDAIHFNYGTVWLADYNNHLVWRIRP